MTDNVIGYGWKGWLVSRSLIDSAVPFLDPPIAAQLQRLLLPTENWSYDDLKTLHNSLLQELENVQGLEGLIGLQTPAMFGQITEGDTEPDGPNVHLLTALATAIHTIVGGWHVSHIPKAIIAGEQ